MATKIKTVQMMLCESCGEYHPIDEMETVVIKITKGVDCKLVSPTAPKPIVTNEPKKTLENEAYIPRVVPVEKEVVPDVTRRINVEKFTPEIAKTHNAQGEFDGIVVPPM